MSVPLVYFDETVGKWAWNAAVWVATHESYSPADREDEPFRGYSLTQEDRVMLGRLAARLEAEEDTDG